MKDTIVEYVLRHNISLQSVAMLRQLILLITNKPTNFSKNCMTNMNLKYFYFLFLEHICVFRKHLRVNISILLDLLQIEIAFNGSYNPGNYK